MKLKKLFRAMETDAESVKVDKENRTVEFPFSSEYPVDRYFGKEVLSHEKSAINLERAKLGAIPLLFNHDPDQLIGTVEEIRLESDKRAYAKVRFSEIEDAEKRFKQWQEGVLRNVSFGYVIDGMDLKNKNSDGVKEYLATDWTIYEISCVSIPADPTVGQGRSDAEQEFEVKINNSTVDETPSENEGEKRNMETEIKQAKEDAIKLERERATAIAAMGERHGQVELARQLVDSGKSIDDARAAMLEKIGAARKPVTGTEGEIGLTTKELAKFSFMRAIRAMANPGDRKLQEDASFERDVSNAAAKVAGKTPQGFMVPVDVLRASTRDLNIGTSTAGGHLVSTDLKSGSFIDMLRNKSVLDRAGATVLNGLVGNIAIPRQTSGATAYWVAESGAPTESAQAFDQVTMAPKTVGAFVDFSRKLILQSSIDVENMVKMDLAKILALEIDRVGLYGSGASNQPTGLQLVSGVNTVDFASNAPTYAEMVSMESAVAADNADFGTMAFLVNALGRGVLKGVDKASGAAQFVWENGNTILGYRTEVSNQISRVTTSKEHYWFGNWADLMIGYWSGLDIMVDPYTGSTSGTVRIVALQDVDVAARHGESFCLGSNLT